ncbi:MAG: hypothetical protein U0235_28265 [Polyangiaceae bacterium]
MSAAKKGKAKPASYNVISDAPKAAVGRDACDAVIEMAASERGGYERTVQAAMGPPSGKARLAMRWLRQHEEAEIIDGCTHIVAAMADAIVAPSTTPADRARLKKAARAILAALEAKS